MPRQRTSGRPREHLVDHLGRRLDDVLDVVLAGLVAGATRRSSTSPPSPTSGDRRSGRRRASTATRHVVARGSTHERRPTRTASDDGRVPLVDQAERLELGRQVADGAAVQPELAGQRGAAGRPVDVHPRQQAR